MTTPAPETTFDVARMIQSALDELTCAHPDDLPGDLAEIAEQLDGASVDDLGSFLTRDNGLHLRTRDGREYVVIVTAR